MTDFKTIQDIIKEETGITVPVNYLRRASALGRNDVEKVSYTVALLDDVVKDSEVKAEIHRRITLAAQEQKATSNQY